MSESEPLLTPLRHALALGLWRARAVRVEVDQPFRLASGNHSPIYVDCRRVIADPAFMRLYAAAAGYLLELRAVPAEVVAGGETAGIPFAAYLASALGRPMAYVRKRPKGHGTGARIEGRIDPGARVLLVEDLITDGGSKLGFLDAIAEVEAEARHVLVLFDREQGGERTLATRGAVLHALADLSTTLDQGQAAGHLSAEHRRVVDAYREDPAAWHAERELEYRTD